MISFEGNAYLSAFSRLQNVDRVPWTGIPAAGIVGERWSQASLIGGLAPITGELNKPTLRLSSRLWKADGLISPAHYSTVLQ
jgi:hypothetical protein